MTWAGAGPPRFDWSLGHYERTAAQLAPMSDVVVEAAPQASERVLDLACGTGNAALLVAGVATGSRAGRLPDAGCAGPARDDGHVLLRGQPHPRRDRRAGALMRGREADLAQEFWVAIAGGLLIGGLFGAGAIARAPLLVAVAICAGCLTARVMRKVLRA